MSGKFGPMAKPAPKGIGKLTSMLPGVGATRKASRKSSSGGKGKFGAGAALLSAAAGLAFKNRDKLAGVVKRRGGGESHTVAPASPADAGTTTTTTGTAATGGISDPNLNGPAGGTARIDPDAPGMGGRTSPA